MTEKDSGTQYAHGVFSEAADIVATGPGPITDRLHAAWMRFHPTFLRDMPTDECRKLFTCIMEGLKGMGPLMEKDGETVAVGSVEATILAMSDERAREIAQWIRELDALLESWCRANNPNPITAPPTRKGVRRSHRERPRLPWWRWLPLRSRVLRSTLASCRWPMPGPAAVVDAPVGRPPDDETS